MNEDMRIITGAAELLNDLKPLREELLVHHAEISEHFASDFAFDSIDKTHAELVACSNKGNLRVELVKDKRADRYIGYCITKVNIDNSGEIFSIFVDEEYRGQGVGHLLVRRALEWLNGKKVESKKVHIIAGNEKVISFYKDFGFYPETIVLKQKEER